MYNGCHNDIMLSIDYRNMKLANSGLLLLPLFIQTNWTLLVQVKHEARGNATTVLEILTFQLYNKLTLQCRQKTPRHYDNKVGKTMI